jgi:GlcNAc-P-P-Und epimerase
MCDVSEKRVLVTGGSGFIGTNLIDHLATMGAETINLDTAPPRNAAQQALWSRCDLRATAELTDAVRSFNPHWLIHMGARTDLEGTTLDDYSANTLGVENVITASREAPALERILFASSRLVCRIGFSPTHDTDYCPTTAYGQSKVEGERIVRATEGNINVPWVIVRPTSIWGPWFDVPYKNFFLTVARGRYFHPKGLEIQKSFGFIGNTVHQIERLMVAAADQIHGKTLYLADYPPIDVRRIAECIQHQLGVRRIPDAPIAALKLVALTGDVAKRLGWRNPPLTSFRLNNLLTPMIYDLRPLEEVVGCLPYTMEAGVDVTVRWLRQQGEV